MNLSLIFFAILTSVAPALAGPLDSSDRAEYVHRMHSGAFMSHPGVVSFGITGCHPETGGPVSFENDEDFVHCVMVGTKDRVTQREFLRRYPQGSKLDNVFIAVIVVGPIESQPRAGAGN